MYYCKANQASCSHFLPDGRCGLENQATPWGKFGEVCSNLGRRDWILPYAMKVKVGMFELVSEDPCPYNTKIFLDGKQVDWVEKVTLIMEPNKTSLSIDINPHLAKEKT